MIRRREHHRPSDQLLRGCLGIVLGARFPLHHGDVSRGLYEPGALLVGDLRLVHPVAIDVDAVPRLRILHAILLAPDPKLAARNPRHFFRARSRLLAVVNSWYLRALSLSQVQIMAR